MKLVALTFDDGPGPETEELVRFLVDEGVAATFFVLGQNGELRPEVVKSMYRAARIELATHSHTHSDLTRLPVDEVRRELERSKAVLEVLTGEAPTLFRPPYGHRNRTVDRIAGKLGQAVILWTLNSMDFRDDHNTSRHVMQQVKPGDIVLLHDTHSSTLTATRELVPALRAKGFVFVTVSELLGGCEPGRVYRGRNRTQVRLARWLRLQLLRLGRAGTLLHRSESGQRMRLSSRVRNGRPNVG